MSAALFVAQRVSAAVLALAVAVHLGTILYAVRGGLTAGDILGRTHGNVWLLGFYATFVIAVAIHAPIGLRNVFREWTAWRGVTLDAAMGLVALALLLLGLRAVIAVFVA
jgi:fumarate reductase subunit C